MNMGSLQAEVEVQNDLNDSGIGQDESITMKKQMLMETEDKIQLLDLSDDVLLYILKHCSPRDLKALGYTCSRLGTLVLDRTLWERVDARDQPVGMNRLAWFLKYGISTSTSEILLSGYAKDVQGCLGRLNSRYLKKHESVLPPQTDAQPSGSEPAPSQEEPSEQNATEEQPVRRGIIRSGPVVQIYDSLPAGSVVNPRLSSVSIVDRSVPRELDQSIPSDNNCAGPVFTLSTALLANIGVRCQNLTSLALDYCNLDCASTSIQQFPKSLKVLSLRGSKCYSSQNYDKTFLFKIQDTLKLLEELNVSECEWVEPSSLLPLSKLPALRRLYMRACCKIGDCVAYSSLATRYGFNALQVIDLRESPVGDSEVSSFGWVASLEELYVSPAPERKRYPQHGHFIGEELPGTRELDTWEEQEPEYMCKLSKTDEMYDNGDATGNVDSSPVSLKRRRRDNGNMTYEEALEYTIYGQRLPACDPPDGSGSAEAKRARQNDVNEGASTSQAPAADETSNSSNEPSEPEPDNADQRADDDDQMRLQRFYRIRQNRQPYLMDRPLEDRRDVRPQGPVQKVLYVNVCRRLHAMYSLAMPVYTMEEPDAHRDNSVRRMNVCTSPFISQQPDPATLVSDASIHRFGRADTDNVSYINIGPSGIQRDQRASRPDRSNLRVLYVSGFRSISNRSLVHLVTAAPRLRLLDVTGTRVNERGVENFKSLRPDCEVLYTKHEEKKSE